ncbi:MAG: 23S rRNA (adenine(2503)-C(2))-methyltransferase RlmN [Spirochaetaceae bacterium]|nr:23S rRNA (adenine(2503)-C(2))-methyltransferase RlmN [Spirochaetaceae bacterium]
MLKPSLSGAPVSSLEDMLAPLPKYRAKQIFAWINAGAGAFDLMTNLPRSLRNELDERFCLRKTSVINSFEDNSGGAVKLQISIEGGIIEAVALVDAAGRRTACLSTQLGCAMGCVFCKTGGMGFKRNLDSSEITEQFYHIRDLYPDVANIVFMGMGEPLHNLSGLRQAVSTLCETSSQRRITVSTCGITEGIMSLADEGPAVRLAVSLTTAREALRRKLMPVSSANPLNSLKEALLYHQERHRRRITLEAVALGGVNTSDEDAAAMAGFARGLSVVVNLIPWNPVENLLFEGKALKEPSAAELKRFRAALEARGLKTVLRREKGRGIAGACGQLGATENV